SNTNLSYAHYNLEMIYKLKSDSASSTAEFETASRLRPDDANLHARLGSAWAKAGDLDRGIEELRTALRLNPDSTGNHYILARMSSDERRVGQVRTPYRMDAH